MHKDIHCSLIYNSKKCKQFKCINRIRVWLNEPQEIDSLKYYATNKKDVENSYRHEKTFIIIMPNCRMQSRKQYIQNIIFIKLCVTLCVCMCVCDISGRKKNTSKGHTPKKVNNGYLYISIKEIYVFFSFMLYHICQTPLIIQWNLKKVIE